MKYLSLLIVAFFSLVILLSCGGEAPKKTDKIKNEIKRSSPKENTEKKIEKEESKEAESSDTQDTTGATPEQLAKAKEIIAAISEDDVAAVKAEKKYKMLCSACHGFTGDLNVNGAKDLTTSLASMEDRVAQVYFGKGLMTPFKGILSDAEIVAVSQYIETLRN